ncbi:hypothetical protein HETIRDRAFT_482604 [Heterobasidion irregulare TC 32-1]|uniref:F-box domain-containing protein n=1 Tax=Heterobasidion irregulare (strain TC 32-1) TaxID=747525 RepID=W4JP17_HETIT|nr:uncharacterized protein HETIRDRAFT_482604 [Heterobasidion irregulare TC 32-1]ETW74810.1 hypothetical protein HETIRDRAFT_482604 [Heterobasidion irregulare TC 32-1]
MPFRPEKIPLDILYPILEHLDDRLDLHAAALTSRCFNAAATPLLYRKLDTRTKWEDKASPIVLHPAVTILQKPMLARYVREVRETGVMHHTHPTITETVFQALRLCTNLSSFAWNDDSYSSGQLFKAFLKILKDLPLRSLTIRTYSDLGEPIWVVLNEFTGLHKIAIWCMNGPPRVLQGWAGVLGDTLTELELGRCAGVPATILISVLSQLPRLRVLNLKGAPSAAIPDILASLPNLQALDTEFLGSGILRRRPADLDEEATLPRLRRLTVRTSSVDLQGPQRLWVWLHQLIPRPSLEAFVLNAFSTQGQTTIPRHFLLALAHTHGGTLKSFLVNMTQLTLEDIECLCTLFPRLEALSCAVASPDPIARSVYNTLQASIEHVIAKAKHLHSLRLHVHWIPDMNQSSQGLSTPLSSYLQYSPRSPSARFGRAEAEALMRREGSLLRTVSMGPHMYKGSWMRMANQELKFVVEEDSAVGDSWL